jgi:hypothetical protein
VKRSDRQLLAAQLEEQGKVCLDATDLFGAETAIVALDANGDGATFDREIVLTGDYKNRKFSITRAHLDKMIENQRLAQVDPAVDREHESWLDATAQEARGWVKNLRVEPSKLRPGRDALVGTFELNDLGQTAIRNKHFRYVSAGINFKAKDRLSNDDIGAFLDHVALVKHPYVQGMQPLTLSAGTQAGGEEEHMKAFATVVLAALGMGAEVDEEKALAAFQKREQERADETKALTERASKAEKDLVDARAALQAGSDAKAVADVDAAILAKKLDPSEREDQIDLAKADRARFDKLLSKRTPREFTPPIVTAKKPETEAALLTAQEAAVDAEIKADPAASVATAAMRAAAKNPALFGAAESEGA